MNRRSNEYHIEIANQQTRPFDGERLIAAVEMVLKDHGITESEISIAVVDDPTIRELNRNYLGHDYETDVISFVLEADAEHRFLTGQLVVSLDTAASVAKELGIPLEHELMLYVIHGSLHLVGFDHQEPDGAREMRAAERDFLDRLGVACHWPQADEHQQAASNHGAD